MPTDLEIASKASFKDLEEITKAFHLPKEAIIPYGKNKAKVDVDLIEEVREKEGKLILVSAINPTKAGEGKSTTTIGLADALNLSGYPTMAALREPSLGPVFGLKGGAAGGGYAQVIPMEDINLHFTGDMHAITTANDLLCALVDNHIYQGNELNLDPERLVIKRCLDMNDRTLRDITIAQNKAVNGVERSDHFVITVASEVMAALCLASDLQDLKERFGKMLIGYTYEDKPVYVRDLDAQGAMALVMKDAILPNLVQTLENNPVLIHGGPFANIAHGCNSLIATKTALKLADYVVTEAGFGADLGAEKFLDIKSRAGNLHPDCVVLVATIRALKLHGGLEESNLKKEDLKAVKKGLANLQKHIETIEQFKLPFVICLNHFSGDSQAELDLVQDWAKEHDYPFAISKAWEKGGKGAIDLAKEVIQQAGLPNEFTFLYELEDSVKEKISKISKKAYGAKDVLYSEQALKDLEEIKENGWDDLAICMAKTPLSLSDQADLKGRPENFDIHVQRITPSLSAGFLVVLCGNVLTMPGLPKKPAALNMDIDENGTITGLF